jgi:hypothetical protein
MGYTHYWEKKESVTAEKFAEFTENVKSILQTADDAGIPISGFDGVGSAFVSDNEVAFNGFSGYGHESFNLLLEDVDGFCKTAGKPYDSVVCAVLMLLKVTFGNAYVVTSDGNWSDWSEGRVLYTETFADLIEESAVF